MERPETIQQLRAEASGRTFRPAKRATRNSPLAPVEYDPDDLRYLFTVCTGNRWMELGSRQPPAQMLFGEFWHQGELCILFADSNAGKSVLAVQIGDSIARAKPIAPFAGPKTPEKVLYIDFELTNTQFYQRYTGQTGQHQFSDNFLRAEFDPATGLFDDATGDNDLLFAGIEAKAQLVNATVLLIDNITCLRGGTESAAVALKLMQSLKNLKTQLNLSILVLAHIPKRRHPTRPITADDLHGSKLLINFADAAFAIGKSNTHRGRCYLKQLKQRNTRQIYHQDNVCLCHIQKVKNCLQFQFEGTGAERDQLTHRANATDQQVAQQAAQLAATGHTQRQISQQLNLAVGTVNKLLKNKTIPPSQ